MIIFLINQLSITVWSIFLNKLNQFHKLIQISFNKTTYFIFHQSQFSFWTTLVLIKIFHAKKVKRNYPTRDLYLLKLFLNRFIWLINFELYCHCTFVLKSVQKILPVCSTIYSWSKIPVKPCDDLIPFFYVVAKSVEKQLKFYFKKALTHPPEQEALLYIINFQACYFYIYFFYVYQK